MQIRPVGCGLLRFALGHYLDWQPSTVPVLRTCPTCGRPHGKPRLPSTLPRIDLSVSHGGDQVAVALSHSAAVGVDVEPVPASFPVDALVPYGLSPGEAGGLEGLSETRQTAALLRYWTRKEAVVKATGKGPVVPLPSFAVTGPEDPPRIIDWSLALGFHTQMSLHDLHPGTGHLASLAVPGERVEVTELDGSSLLELHCRMVGTRRIV